MRIIVIDDLEINRNSASLLREAGHDVTIIGTAEEAVHALRNEVPDVVLTDLWMPWPQADEYGCVNGVVGCSRDKRPFETIPAGYLIALLAKNRGVPHVAILSDTDHHNDRMSALAKGMAAAHMKPYLPKGAVLLYEQRYYDTEGVCEVKAAKDWRKLLEELLA